MKCKDCTHWDKITSVKGKCEYPQFVDEIQHFSEKDGFAIMFYALDDSGVELDLMTGCNFYCYKFQSNSRKGKN